MALSLLDGTNAAIDMVITIASATNSVKCSFGYMSADVVREFTEKTTFCSSGWRSRQPGMKQVVGHLDGFVSKGAAKSQVAIGHRKLASKDDAARVKAFWNEKLQALAELIARAK